MQREWVSLLAGAFGVTCAAFLMGRPDSLPPFLMGVALAYILRVLWKIRSQKRGIPVRDERTEANARKVMLASLLWSHLLLGSALMIWIALGHETVPAQAVIMYIAAALMVTSILMAIARKR